MNSSSLSPLKPKSLIKQKQSPTTLPPISSGQPLKYQNDYESYQDELHEYKLQKAQQRQQSSVSLSSVSKSISGVSSSISSVSSPKKSQSKVMIQATKSTQKIVPYQDSPQFWQPTATTPYIQYSQHEQYKDISAQIIQQQIKEMRQHLIQMNRQLGQRLEHYHMGKTQFVVKELIKESKPQFYINQIQTNKKVQQAQINQLKKLNETEFTVKDKDILLDLQQVLIQMRQQLHQLKKQQHDSKLKNHKQDILLQEIIRVNNDNKDNNAVKLLKLQIIYYMKKQAQLKIHEEHLDHEEKLIKENDKNLEKKVEEMRKDEKSKRYVYLLDEKWADNKKKYEQLLEKRKTLKKNIQAIKRSNDINEEKIAREMIELNNTYKTSIKPLMTKYQEDNEQIQSKINTIIQAYNLNEKALSNISYKFPEDTVTKFRSISQKPFFKGVLKSGFRAQNSSRLSSINDQSDQTSNEAFLTSLKKDNSYRYNDKNVATIDTSRFEQKQKVRSVSEMDGKLKPKGFRIGKNKDNNKSFSIAVGTQNHYKTLDASHNDINKMIDLPKMKMLKPKLLAPSTARTGKY